MLAYICRDNKLPSAAAFEIGLPVPEEDLLLMSKHDFVRDLTDWIYSESTQNGNNASLLCFEVSTFGPKSNHDMNKATCQILSRGSNHNVTFGPRFSERKTFHSIKTIKRVKSGPQIWNTQCRCKWLSHSQAYFKSMSVDCVVLVSLILGLCAIAEHISLSCKTSILIQAFLLIDNDENTGIC